MGNSLSSNITKIITDSVVNVSSTIAQNVKISTDQSQIIYISGTGGDVVIRGNKMIQRAYMNMNAMFDALSSESVQQNIALEIAQTAKALTSGLNLAQFSEAYNDLDLVIQTAINIVSTISQECSSLATQTQRITIVNTIGSVIIENNLFDQVESIFQSCIETAANNSAALQAVSEKIKQDSSATAQGISEWAAVAIVALFIGVPTIGAVVGGKAVLQYLFPILVIVGVVMLIVYYEWYTTVVSVKGYSKFIAQTPGCLAQPPGAKPDPSFASAEAAGTKCFNDPKCAAFDWQGIVVYSDGSYKLQTPPLTTFYTSVSGDCDTTIGTDNVQTLRSPVFFSGNGPPPATPPAGVLQGDCYVDLLTSKWYQLVGQWFDRGTAIVGRTFTKLTVSTVAPKTTDPGQDGEARIVVDPTNPMYLSNYGYTVSTDGWKYVDRSTGPGLFAAAPPVTNGSGFKKIVRKDWLWYTAVASVVIGLLGTAVTFYASSKGGEAAVASKRR